MKRAMALFYFVLIVFLSGCANNQSQYIKEVDLSKYKNKETSGVFKQFVNGKFADIWIDDSVKMFALSNEVVTQMEGLNEKDELEFIYKYNKETMQDEIIEIKSVNGVNLEEQERLVKEAKQKEIEFKRETMEKIEVQYGDKTEEVYAQEVDFVRGKIKVLEHYGWNGTEIKNKDTKIKFKYVEDTIENDVLREKNRAINILSGIGEIKEEDYEERKGVQFALYAENEEMFMEIMVFRNQYGYFLAETTTTVENKEQVKDELTAMLATIH